MATTNANRLNQDTGDEPPGDASRRSTPVKASPGISTNSVHAGEARQKPADAITDGIYCASTYTFVDTQAIIDFIEQQQQREEYGRYGNPGTRVVEEKLAALEAGERAVLFSSGMSAIAGLLNAILKSGDEVVYFNECYHRTREYCSTHLAKFGVVAKEVQTGDYDAMEAAISPRTRLLISESPTNPQLSIIDLERFVDIGRRHSVETMIDATLATPYNLQPLRFGVDYVVHSATKYLGGHNDLLAGCVVGSSHQLEPISYLRGVTGGITGAHTAYLLERGLKTFELRMQRHNANGQAVAEFLNQHERVEHVYYPGLASHPNHDLAQRTMTGFGGLVTFQVAHADWRATADIVDRCQVARIAPSLGGVETLIEQPLVMSYFAATPEERAAWGIHDNMIRISCGIENTADLIADLTHALKL